MINMKEEVNTSTVVTKENLQKNYNNKIKIILILRLTQSNQWVGVDHATQIPFLNSPPVTGSVEKKMIVMMIMILEK